MPQWSLRWLVLLLLVPLSSSAQLKGHCKDKEMACFVNTKCTNTDPQADNYVATISYEKNCDANLEIRPYSDNKALIRLRAKKAPIKVVYQDAPNVPIFGCDLANGNAQSNVEADQKEFSGYKVDSSGIACQFIYEFTPLFDTTKIIDIIYANNEVSAGTFANQIGVYMKKFIKCDMDWLKNGFEADDKWITVEADRRFNKVECKDKEKQLVYQDEEKVVHEVAGGIVCEQEPNDEKWRYLINKDAEIEGNQAADAIVVNADATATVGCRSRVCAQCKKPQDCKSPAICPELKETADGCKILECAGNITKVNDEQATIGHAECQLAPPVEGEEGDEKKFRWMFGTKEVKKIECAKEVSCNHLHPLQLDEIDVGEVQEVKCEDQKKISVDDILAKSITCDVKTGKWLVNKTQDLARDAKLTCTEVETSTPVATGAMGDFALKCTLGVIGGLIIAASAAIIVFCLVCKQKMQKRKAAKKIKTIASSRPTDTDLQVKTALPAGYQPPPTAPSSDPLKPPKPEPELVEKTMIAHTPEPNSVVMKTAILPAMTKAEEDEQELKDRQFADNASFGAPQKVTDLKKLQQQMLQQQQQQKSRSDGSDPLPVRIGENGEILGKGKADRSGEKSEDKSKQSETKKEEKPAKPVDNGPKPRVFALDPKEEKIRKGATVKASAYPTLAEIDSDWEDYDEAKAKAAGNVEAGKKKKGGPGGRGKTTDKTKTVPTAVTPDVNPDKQASIDRTQATNTRHSVDKGETDMENLVTQLDTTAEQKQAESKKNKP